MQRDICRILSNHKVTGNIYKMVIESRIISKKALPGQFIHIKPGDGYDPLLRRPISICDLDADNSQVTLLYRVCGKGTRLFTHTKTGDFLDVLGPLGNGFPIFHSKRVAIIGGGIGIAPLLYLSKELIEAEVYLGFRDETYMIEDFMKYSDNISIYTEDGSKGNKGYPIEALERNIRSYDVVYACGPKIMLRAVKNLCEENHIECYISMEERMGCGIGACLVCACESSSNEEYKKVCTDGPVFNSKEVNLDD
ncbi:dihydroorotate dehydrogenase electron transfer subunit [Lutispora sp.]|uniref:dihydroorotate dehydrogenase electron transfer subunit n=1 Tax=Lutispora sp. TaxID=2828727 RepID=UPI00356A5764